MLAVSALDGIAIVQSLFLMNGFVRSSGADGFVQSSLDEILSLRDSHAQKIVPGIAHFDVESPRSFFLANSCSQTGFVGRSLPATSLEHCDVVQIELGVVELVGLELAGVELVQVELVRVGPAGVGFAGAALDEIGLVGIEHPGIGFDNVDHVGTDLVGQEHDEVQLVGIELGEHEHGGIRLVGTDLCGSSLFGDGLQCVVREVVYVEDAVWIVQPEDYCLQDGFAQNFLLLLGEPGFVANWSGFLKTPLLAWCWTLLVQE